MDDQDQQVRTVGVIADPGLAQKLADKVCLKFQARLNALDAAQQWQVVVDPFSLPLGESGRVILNENVPRLRKKHGWDFVIYLTDVPHYERERPVRSVLSPGQGSATLSIPSLGIALPRTVVKALVEIIRELTTGQQPAIPPTPLGRAISVRGRWGDPEQDDDRLESIEGLRGRMLLIVGMVRSYRPWRLVPHLSSAMAGATATGAFGVFYTSIWSMSDYLSSPRLSLITGCSILLLTFWLLFHNRLWERPRGYRRRERLVVYNIATVLSVAWAAAAMYVLLFLALLLAALVVIDQQFLASQLGHPIGLGEYLNLAWLAASLGTLGGAIGSSFDDVRLVQRATFSQREYERRNMDFGLDTDEQSSS